MAQTPEQRTKERLQTLAEAKRAEAAELKSRGAVFGQVGRSITSLAAAVGGQLEADAETAATDGSLVARFRELKSQLVDGTPEDEALGVVLGVMSIDMARKARTMIDDTATRTLKQEAENAGAAKELEKSAAQLDELASTMFEALQEERPLPAALDVLAQAPNVAAELEEKWARDAGDVVVEESSD